MVGGAFRVTHGNGFSVGVHGGLASLELRHAAVGLHGNTFKPRTGTTTSVLFVQKWTKEQLAKRQAIRNKHAAEFRKHFAELEEAVALRRSSVPELGRVIQAEELGGEKDDEELAKEKKSFGKHLSAFSEDNLESDAEKLEKEAIGKPFADKTRYVLEGKALKMRKELVRRSDRWALWYLAEYLSHAYEKQWLGKRAVGTELDYAIFFATQRRPCKDKSGDRIFVKRPVAAVCDRRNGNGKNGGHRPPLQDEMALREVPDTYKTGVITDEYLLDNHGHLIVDHDLFNHDGLTQDGIAGAFQEFAKKEKLSFF